MNKVRVAIVGAGLENSSIIHMLTGMEHVQVIGIMDITNQEKSNVEKSQEGLCELSSIDDLIDLPDLDVVIETTGDPRVQGQLYKLKRAGTSIMEARAVDLMMSVCQENKELLEFKRIQSELSAILNSVQEAIEVADNQGVIKYVNPAFTKITGISPDERIGQNIYDASPDGALASVLRKGEKVFGYRTLVGGSNAEVISNASPIVVDGKTEGAVVVFQHFTDIMKMMDELRKRTVIIESLSDKFVQVTTSKYTYNDILGHNQELRRCTQISERAARSNSTVLLLGESGTGKELFAHAIHHASPRREKPFIKVNCAAIPESLLESEFFGYMKGAFTGAVKSKIGKFELAHGGTIFMDEIGDMNLNLQGKLLRVLQEMEFERVGGNQTICVDVRVIAATNRNLPELIRQGLFREDLYYRLNVVEITIPPLRVRKEDLPLLVNNLIVKLNRKLGKKVKGISEDAEEILFGYDWPGNIRELENVVERVMVTVDEEILTKKNFLQHVSQFKSFPENDFELMSIDQMEQLLIRKAMAKYGSSVEGKRRAAQKLNISLATLYNKLKKSRTEILNN